MKKAWLVTWNGTGRHAEWEGKVAFILNYRLAGETVAKHIERHYIDSFGSLSERLSYAKSRKNTTYPAGFGRFNGVTWFGQIHCGHNPFLYGRLVQNIHVEVDSDGNERLEWEEIPSPKKT